MAVNGSPQLPPRATPPSQSGPEDSVTPEVLQYPKGGGQLHWQPVPSQSRESVAPSK